MSNLHPTDSQSPVQSKSGLSPRTVYVAIRRHPLALTGILLFAAAVGCGVLFFLPLPKSTAAVVFQVSGQTSLLNPSAEGSGGLASYKQSQAALIKSRRTLNAALKEPGILGLHTLRTAEPNEIAWLEKYLTVDLRSNAEFMRVTLEGDHDDDLLAILNSVQKSYLAAVNDREQGARKQRLEELTKSLAGERTKIKSYRESIDKIAVSLRASDGPTLAVLDEIRKGELWDTARELSKFRVDREYAEFGLSAAKGAMLHPTTDPQVHLAYAGVVGAFSVAVRPSIVPAEKIAEALRGDPLYREFDDSVARARQSLAETEGAFQAGVTPTPPSVVQARADLKTAEERRDKYARQSGGKIEDAIRDSLVQTKMDRVTEQTAKVTEIENKIKVVTAKQSALQNEINQVTLWRIQLESLKGDIAQNEKVAVQLADQISFLTVDLKAPPRVSLAEEPFLIVGLEGNRRLKFALLGTVGVLLAGFAALVWWESSRRRVTHSDQVSSGLGARLIGTIPPLVSAAGGPAGDSRAVLVEAIDTARTMLLHANRDGHRLRTVLVTSAVSGEGKTTLSGHLAISLARAGFRTLLVDGDLQAPSAHVLFDLPAAPGLSELLRGEAGVSAGVHSTRIPGLSVLPAGGWTMTTRQMLVGERWRDVKNQLEAEFDFVVIDTAPLLFVTDTLLIARDVDGVLLSVLLGVSVIARVAETIAKLEAVGATLTGVVVNNVPSAACNAGYGSRFRYPATLAPDLLPVGAGAGSAGELVDGPK